MDKFWNYSRVADEGQERGRECCHLVIAVLTWPRVVNFFFCVTLLLDLQLVIAKWVDSGSTSRRSRLGAHVGDRALWLRSEVESWGSGWARIVPRVSVFRFQILCGGSAPGKLGIIQSLRVNRARL